MLGDPKSATRPPSKPVTYCFVVRLVDGPAQQHGSSETEMASTDAPAPASAIASFAAATSIVGRVTGALSGGAAKRMEEVLCASALAFINADIDSNRKLDFEEFKELVAKVALQEYHDKTHPWDIPVDWLPYNEDARLFYNRQSVQGFIAVIIAVNFLAITTSINSLPITICMHAIHQKRVTKHHRNLVAGLAETQ